MVLQGRKSDCGNVGTDATSLVLHSFQRSTKIEVERYLWPIWAARNKSLNSYLGAPLLKRIDFQPGLPLKVLHSRGKFGCPREQAVLSCIQLNRYILELLLGMAREFQDGIISAPSCDTQHESVSKLFLEPSCLPVGNQVSG